MKYKTYRFEQLINIIPELGKIEMNNTIIDTIDPILETINNNMPNELEGYELFNHQIIMQSYFSNVLLFTFKKGN